MERDPGYEPRSDGCTCPPIPAVDSAAERAAIESVGAALRREYEGLPIGLAECGHEVRETAWEPGFGACFQCRRWLGRRVRIVGPVAVADAAE